MVSNKDMFTYEITIYDNHLRDMHTFKPLWHKMGKKDHVYVVE